jgi:hypothetical protein
MLEKVNKRNSNLKYLFQEAKSQSQSDHEEAPVVTIVDLNSLLPPSFQEIPYLAQINAKK